MCNSPRFSTKLEANLIQSKSKSNIIKIIIEATCCHGERWREVESLDERLIMTIPRMPADVARVVFVDDVVGSGMTSPK